MHAHPDALIVEDNQDDADFAALLLHDAGFLVHHAPSLLRGIEQAQQLLDLARPPRPCLILLDVMLPTSRCPELEGRTAAAYLLEQMETGRLHPAHLVAITAEPDHQRIAQARLAGCTCLLEKPLTTEQAHMLAQVVATPVVLPAQRTDAAVATLAARHSLRQDARALVRLLRAEQVGLQTSVQRPLVPRVAWTEADVRQLLFAPHRLLAQEPWRTWGERVGGIAGIHHVLLRQVPQRDRPLLAAILAHGTDWRSVTEALRLPQSTYYRRRDTLIQTLAMALTLGGDQVASDDSAG